MTDLAHLRKLAQEALEWVADFEDGRFHVHCQKCFATGPYLPVELFGLVESEKELAHAVEALLGVAEAAQRLKAIGPNWTARDFERLGMNDALARLQAIAVPEGNHEAAQAAEEGEG